MVSGIAVLQKGADAQPTLDGIHAKVKELNDQILPKGVKIVPFIDRSELLHFTTHTVLHNLTEGMILVVIILFLFLGNVRGAIIVALTIPFSLLFAAICLDLKHIPANLLSLGALDFGMVVEGAVVMVENIVRHLASQGRNRTSVQSGSAKPRTKCSGRSFTPSPSSSPPICPSLPCKPWKAGSSGPWPGRWPLRCWARSSFPSSWLRCCPASLFSKGAKEWKNPVMEFSASAIATASPGPSITTRRAVGGGVCALILAVFLAFSGVIGSEFLPHLDEGALWVRGTLEQSVGPDESIRVANEASRTPLLLSRSHRVHQPDRPPRRRNRPYRLLQHRVLRGPEAEGAVAPVFHAEQGQPDRLHEP